VSIGMHLYILRTRLWIGLGSVFTFWRTERSTEDKDTVLAFSIRVRNKYKVRNGDEI